MLRLLICSMIYLSFSSFSCLSTDEKNGTINYLITENSIGNFVIDSSIEDYQDKDFFYENKNTRTIFFVVEQDTLCKARYSINTNRITGITTDHPSMHLLNNVSPGMSIRDLRRIYPTIDANIQPRVTPVIPKASVVFTPPEFRKETIGSKTLYFFLEEDELFTDTVLCKISILDLINGF